MRRARGSGPTGILRSARRQASTGYNAIGYRREKRVRTALERMPEMEAKKKADAKAKARVSTTDPEATVLRLLVRGRQKVKAIALWFAVTQNVMRALSLRASVGIVG